MTEQPVTSFDIKELASRLVSERKKLNLSRDDVIELSTTGFARSSLQEWEGAKREPKLEYIYDLARIYGVSPWTLLSGQEKLTTQAQLEPANGDEYVYIPAYDIAVSAGHGMFSEGTLKPDKHLAFRKRWVQARNLNPLCLAALFTEGDSMVPTIPDNAAIVINRERIKALDGKVYVIRIDDRLYVKRTQWLIGGGLRLISDNKFYDPLDVTKEDMQASDIEICGQVIHTSYDLPD